MKRVATIESIGSSTRIEGSKLTDKEVEVLLSNLEIRKFETRDEQEVAGYAEVMNIIFQSHDEIGFTENYIQQLHAELLQYSEKDAWHRGNYKKSPNHVEAFGPDGKSLGIIFETVTPFETPMLMQELVKWTSEAIKAKKYHPLLITSVFVVEFLDIHPFQDGNGRLSRVLTTLLLLKTGYEYVPYSSMESIIEQNKQVYYIALRKTQKTLRTEKPNWQPWVVFFLKTLGKQVKRLEEKITQEKLLFNQLPELSMQILELIKSRGRATVKDVVAVLGANRNTVKKHLESLVELGHLRQNGVGKGTWYSL